MPLRIIDDYFDPAFWCVASCCVGWVVSTIFTAVFAVLGMFVYMYIFLMAPVIFPLATMVALFFIAIILDYRDHLQSQSMDRTFYFRTGLPDLTNNSQILINPVMREPPRLAMHAEAIASLPTFDYEKQETIESMQCTICLTAFEEGEEVKQLPRCNHLYHSRCIDQWLRQNYTCPICRDSAEKDEYSGEFVIALHPR